MTRRYTDRGSFLRNIGNAHQMLFGTDERDAIMGDYPTLTEIDESLGRNTSQQWLVKQVADLSLFSGAKNPSDEQLEQTSRIIVQEYSGLKYSEVLLFFYRFKRADFGKFYGGVDPLSIMSALREFSIQLNTERWNYRYEEIEKERQEIESRLQEKRDLFLRFKEALCLGQSGDDQAVFSNLTLDGFDLDQNILRIICTKAEYEAVEGRLFSRFAKVFAEYFQKASVQYHLYTPVEPKQDQPIKVRTVVKKPAKLTEVQVGVNSAHVVLDNKYKFDKSGVAVLRDAFRKRYGCFPEDYLARHEEVVEEKSEQPL